MQINFDSLKPIYVQIAEAIEDDILVGKLSEGAQVYSQLLLSKELNVNPATAAKGINVLVQKGILEKQRGLAMTVVKGSKKKLLEEKYDKVFLPLAKAFWDEAQKINLSEEQVIATIKDLYLNAERSGQDE